MPRSRKSPVARTGRVCVWHGRRCLWAGGSLDTERETSEMLADFHNSMAERSAIEKGCTPMDVDPAYPHTGESVLASEYERKARTRLPTVFDECRLPTKDDQRPPRVGIFRTASDEADLKRANDEWFADMQPLLDQLDRPTPEQLTEMRKYRHA